MGKQGWGVVKALLSESDISPKHNSIIDGIHNIRFRHVQSSWIAAIAWLPLALEYRKQHPGHGLLLVKTRRDLKPKASNRVYAYLAQPHVYARMLSGASVGRVMNRSLLHSRAKAAMEVVL